jgi:hypothetical protein
LSQRLISEIVCNAHSRFGGASVHLHFGDLRGQSLFAVSLYPERTVRIEGREIPREVVIAFCRQHKDLLGDPRVVIGTWYNTEEDITYLDVTAICCEMQEAVTLGQRYNQIALYDLEHDAEIDLGGTGEEPPDIPPEHERLPLLQRGERE